MRMMTSVAALAVLAALAGCGASAGAGENWIFYSWEQTSTGPSGTSKRTLHEAINIKYVTNATYAEKGADDKPMLSLMVSGKEATLYGDQAEKVWKSLQKNN